MLSPLKNQGKFFLILRSLEEEVDQVEKEQQQPRMTNSRDYENKDKEGEGKKVLV
jgi:hypothetical protein